MKKMWTKYGSNLYGPTEGKWFDVNPLNIDQTLFEIKRADEEQEVTRRLIMEAFEEVKNNPEKYGKKFKTMRPRKTWKSKNVAELIDLACKLGDNIADGVEQALEWAQRVDNGESWEALCNDPDNAKWRRLILWKSGYARTVGGSRDFCSNYPASRVGSDSYYSVNSFIDTVPLVVRYEN